MGGAPTMSEATVVVDQGRILAVAPMSQLTVDDADVIDCRGSFVMPGLADLHGHVSSRRQWPLWLAHGVTTVRDMWGSRMQLTWRDDMQSGPALGPRLVCASPYLDGPMPDGSARYPGVVPVSGADAARAAAETHVAAGYDALKVYSGLGRDELAAVGGVGHAAGVPVVGHCPQSMTFEEALAAGLLGFEHLVEWWRGRLTGTEPVPGDVLGRVAAIDARLDPSSLRPLAARLVDAGAHVTPTLTVYGHVADIAADHEDDPALAHMPAAARARWSRAGIRVPAGSSLAALKAGVRRQRQQVGQIARLLADGGVPVRVGTDAGSIWTVPGFSMAEELALLVEAGFGSLEVLEAATAGAAETCGQRERWGRVAVGLEADLLVVADDPRVDVTASTRPSHVVSRGMLFDRAVLDGALAAHAREVDAEPSAPADELAPMARPEWWDR
jgi:imidazolonepropionase-like amidohydrolase